MVGEARGAGFPFCWLKQVDPVWGLPGANSSRVTDSEMRGVLQSVIVYLDARGRTKWANYGGYGAWYRVYLDLHSHLGIQAEGPVEVDIPNSTLS